MFVIPAKAGIYRIAGAAFRWPETATLDVRRHRRAGSFVVAIRQQRMTASGPFAAAVPGRPGERRSSRHPPRRRATVLLL